MKNTKNTKNRKGTLYHFYTERENTFYGKRVTDLILEYRDSRDSKFGEHLFKIIQKRKDQSYNIKESKIILMDYELVHLSELGKKMNIQNTSYKNQKRNKCVDKSPLSSKSNQKYSSNRN